MKYFLEANLKDAKGNIYNGRIKRMEFGGRVKGVIKNENGNILVIHTSITLDLLERYLLSKVNFDKEKDTYTKNW